MGSVERCRSVATNVLAVRDAVFVSGVVRSSCG